MIKNCQTCNTKFDGRRDAKTCSVRCRKRLQRAKTTILHEAGVLKQDAEQVINTLKGEIIPVNLQPATALAEAEPEDLAQSDEPSGFEDSNWHPQYLDLASAADFASPPTAQPITGIGTARPGLGTEVAVPSAPLPISAQPLPQPVVQPEPTILALENTASPAPVSPTPVSASVAPAQSAASSLPIPPTTAAPLGPTPTASLNFPTPPRLGLKTRLQALLHNAPAMATLVALTMVMLVGGMFGASKLLHQSSYTPVASNQGDTTFQADENGKLTLNLDTVLAKGKSLTLGQLIADPTTNVLQLAGDFTASGTLSASGGSTFANNSGLVIDKVTVCTAAGCIPNVNIPTITGSSGTAAGTARAVALLDANQTFSGNNKFTGTLLLANNSDSTAALQLQNSSGNAVLTVDTTSNQVTLGKASTLGGKLVLYNASGSGSVSLQAANPAAMAYTITLPAVSGTVCLTSGNCVGLGGAVGGSGTIGTISVFTTGSTVGDSNLSQSGSTTTATGMFNATTALQTGGETRIDLSGNLSNVGNLTTSGASTFSTTGATGFIFKPGTNNVTALQVQNAAGTTTVLDIDSSTNRVGVNLTNPGYAVDVSGDINVLAGNVFRIGGTAICTSGGCAAQSGSGNYLQNSATLQIGANFNLESASINSVAGIIKGRLGQISDLFELQNGSGINVLTFGATGDTLIKPSTDSAIALQIQNTAGKTVLIADTSGGQIVLGNSGASGVTGLAKFNYSGQTGSISLTAANPSSTAYTITLPAETGTICTTGSVCSGYVPTTAGYGYTLFAFHAVFNPADSTTYYFGNLLTGQPSTAADLRRIYIPKAGTIKRVDMRWNYTNGSAGFDTSVFIRLNNTTNTTITTTLDLSNGPTFLAKADLAIAVVAGDYIEFQYDTPAWTPTNPASVAGSAIIYIE